MSIFILVALAFVGVIFLLVFIVAVYFLVAKNTKQKQSFKDSLRKNGTLAQAVILSSRKNKTITNHRGSVHFLEITYQVEVQPEGQTPFQATFTDDVDVTVFERYTLGDSPEEVGRKMWVRYNPANTAEMMFEYYDSDRMLILGRRTFNSIENRNKAIRGQGVEAAAVILEAEVLDIKTRTEKEFQLPVGVFMRFKLEVTPNGRAPYQTETQAAVAEASLGKYQAGKKVIVKFNPQDQTQVAIFRSIE